MMTRQSPLIYLAGPDVFLPDPMAWAARKKAICTAHGLTGVSPLDPFKPEPPEWRQLPLWQVIGLRNEAHIRACDAIIANVTPFRGPSADAGTVFEIGFMRALGRPVFAYATVATLFTERTLVTIGAAATIDAEGETRDAEAMQVERFGRFDNLMIDNAILASGGALVARELPPAARWDDLSVFESCVAAASACLRHPGLPHP